MKLANLKTFEDACKIEGLDHSTCIPDFSASPEKDRKALEAQAKLFIVVRAANKQVNDGKEWIPNWNNWDELKYEPWFDLEGGSSGFRFDGFVAWGAASGVGSRLCFKSRELCEYIATQFIDLYRDIFFN